MCNIPRAPKKNISHLCVSQSGVNKIGYSFVGFLLVFFLLCLFVGSSTKLHWQTWENVTLTKTAACTGKRDICIQMLKQKAIDIVSEHKVYWRICRGPVSVFFVVVAVKKSRKMWPGKMYKFWVVCFCFLRFLKKNNVKNNNERWRKKESLGSFRGSVQRKE